MKLKHKKTESQHMVLNTIKPIGLWGAASLALLAGGTAAAATLSPPPASAGPGAASAMPVGIAPSAPGAVITDTPVGRPVSFEVFLPLRNEADLTVLLKQQHDPASPNFHKWLTPAEFGARFGATPASLASARAALAAAHLTVTATHTSSLSVSADVGTVNRSFATNLKSVVGRSGLTRLVAATPMTLPAVLKAQGAIVTAFANRQPFHTNSTRVPVSAPFNRKSENGPYWFTDLRQAYEYPALNARMANGQLLDGSGVKVAIVMASDALDSDIAAMFAHERYTAITGRPAPKITHVAIDGGCTGGAKCDAFDESSLDTQQVLGGAPGAKVTLLNTPDLSDTSIHDAYLYVVESNAFDIVSSSFGGCELYDTAAYNGGVDYTNALKVYDAIFRQGNAQGITWVASSGDEGGPGCLNQNALAGQGQASFVKGVEFPSDSPSVTGVGGGNLVTSTPQAGDLLNSAYVTENSYGDPLTPTGNRYGLYIENGYWGATGGQSVVFAAPSYQSLVKTGSSQRTIPDIGMQVGGCPSGSVSCGPQRSSVYIYSNGAVGGVIGTSVSAPEFAGALALYVQRKGRQGNVNPFLYKQAAAQAANSSLTYFHQRIPGFDGIWNNTYPGGSYDYLYGNGSPRVRNLFGLTDLPAAGKPQTPSNP